MAYVRSFVPVLALLAVMQVRETPPRVPAAPIAGSGAISGVVVDGSTGAPIADAVIYLGPPNQKTGQPRRTLTDERGRFLFQQLGPLPDGYSLGASKSGYLPGNFGPGGGTTTTRIFLADGEWFATAKIVLSRPSAISGTITDERGDPVVGAYVRVLAGVTVAGVTHLAGGPAAKTDDRGVYRIGALVPGKYIVTVPSVQVGVSADAAAKPLLVTFTAPEPTLEIDASTRLVLGRYPMPRPSDDGRLRVYAPTYFPGVRVFSDAQTIDLKRGEDREGINLRLQPVSAVRVSGTVTGSADAIPGLRLRLLAEGVEGLGDGSETATAMVAADGSFTFASVPSGQYSIVARWIASELTVRAALAAPMVELPMAPNSLIISAMGAPEGAGWNFRELDRKVSAAYWGRARVDVGDRDVTGVSVAMQRGVTISGRGAWDGAPAGGAFLQQEGVPFGIRLQVEPANGDPSLAAPTPYHTGASGPGVFAFEGLLPGQFFLRGTLQPRVKSVVWNGRDMTHQPFDTTQGRDFSDVVVTFTDKAIALAGAVLDDRGRPVPDAMVIAFPVEREQWTNYGFNPPRMRAAPTASNGTYRHANLPPGEYFVAAIRVEPGDDWRRAVFLEAASRVASRVTLDWGDAKTMDLKLVQVLVK